MQANIKSAEQKSHTVKLENRRSMTLTGVSEVVNFSDAAVELITSEGGLNIKGRGLNISRLNTDTGELNVGGEISSVNYTNTKKKKPLFEGLFK